MENKSGKKRKGIEVDNRAYQKKYLEKLLIEEGFFKIKKVKLTEKEKQFKKKYKIAEYPEKMVDDFLNFLIDLKGDVEISKLVIKDYIENKEVKDKNRMLYSSLLKGNLDTNIYNFLAVLLEKIKSINSGEKLIEKFILSTYSENEALENIIKNIRPKIRRLKLLNIDIEDRFKKISYEEKIRIIKEDFDYWLRKFRLNSESWIDRLFFERVYQISYYDTFVQLIIYDILHSTIPLKKREIAYNQILNFLNNFLKDSKELLKIQIKSSLIFIDFFKFIILRETLLRDKNNLEIAKSIEKKFFDKIIPLDKSTLFKNIIFKKLEKFDEGKIENENINCVDFIEINNIRKKMDSKTGIIKLNECREFIEGYKLIESDISEILYNTRHSKNSLKDIYNKSEIIAKKFPSLTQESLQFKRALIRNIENDKTKIFGKRLKTLVFNDKYKELFKTETIQNNIRIRITKGLYEEKGILQSFLRSNELEEKINKILINIYSIKDENLRYKYMSIFVEKFFGMIIEINKNNKVVFFDIPTEKFEIDKNKILENIQKNSKILWENYLKEINN